MRLKVIIDHLNIGYKNELSVRCLHRIFSKIVGLYKKILYIFVCAGIQAYVILILLLFYNKPFVYRNN